MAKIVSQPKMLNYLYLPGRVGGQVAKGDIYFGDPINAEFLSTYTRFGATNIPVLIGELPPISDPLNRAGMVASKTTDIGYASFIFNFGTGEDTTSNFIMGNNLTELGSADVPTNITLLGRTGGNWNDPDLPLKGPNMSYLYSTTGDLLLGSAGTTAADGNTYIFAGARTTRDSITLTLTHDHRVGIGYQVGYKSNPPTEMVEFRGTDGSMFTTSYGNWILGDKVTYANIPAMSINMPDGGYGGTSFKNIIVMSGTQSDASQLYNNINMGLFQRTPTVGNAAFFNFYNALQIDCATFGTIFRGHGIVGANSGDFFIATANNALPTIGLYVKGGKYTGLGKLQTTANGTLIEPLHGFCVVDPDSNGRITISGTGNAVGTTAGIEFNWEKGVGGNTKNLAYIYGYTQAGGGGDIRFATAPNATGAYVDRMTLLRAGYLGINTIAPHSFFQVEGSAAFGYDILSVNTTLTINHHSVEVDTAGVTITLPTAVGIKGRVYEIDNSSSGYIYVTGTSGQTINGETTQIISPNSNMKVQSNSTHWRIK